MVRLRYEAGTPVHMLLSKADLLTPADRQRTLDYISIDSASNCSSNRQSTLSARLVPT